MSVEAITRCGRVEGEQRGAHVAFRGIPFAKPPVGALRFRAPEAPEPWNGVRAALAVRAVGAARRVERAGHVRRRAAERRLPVPQRVHAARSTARGGRCMFWIHGGAFTLGSALAADLRRRSARRARRRRRRHDQLPPRCARLSRTSARTARARGATRNAGQLDQIAALRWVRDNIEDFGGDPEQRHHVRRVRRLDGGVHVCSRCPRRAGCSTARSRRAAHRCTRLDAATRRPRSTDALLADLGSPRRASARCATFPSSA